MAGKFYVSVTSFRLLIELLFLCTSFNTLGTKLVKLDELSMESCVCSRVMVCEQYSNGNKYVEKLNLLIT